MKYIKTYETVKQIEPTPKKFDYVICQDNHYKTLNDFLSTNIGQLAKITTQSNAIVHYKLPLNQTEPIKSIPMPNTVEDYFIPITNINDDGIKYLNSPKDFNILGNGGLRGFTLDEIIFFSPDKETVEAYLLGTNNYNL